MPQRSDSILSKRVPNIILRCVVMILGLAFLALAIALSRSAGLGTSPISSIPLVTSYITGFSVGTFTFCINFFFFLLQLAVQRREFNPLQCAQLPFLLLFAPMIDFFVPLCDLIPMPDYASRVFFMLLSCPCIGFGVFLQVKANIITLPPESFCLMVSYKTGIEFPKLKIAMDVTLTLIAAGLSIVALGGLYGVREGTIVAACTTGLFVKLYNVIYTSIVTRLRHKNA